MMNRKIKWQNRDCNKVSDLKGITTETTPDLDWNSEERQQGKKTFFII
jgi:hypothetical protein